MYVKIIHPPTNGSKVYANSGSARRTTNYLEKEAKELAEKEAKETAEKAKFFGSPEKGTYTADEVVTMLDNKHKGLKKEDAKFYSLVLSPSAQELGEMGNDPKVLERYTQNVMEQYAKNFTLKGGRELGESDLVWAATIHQERKNRGTDAGPQGEAKPGLQTHIHVIVSARDAAQQITLNPLSTPARFNRVEFQGRAAVEMDKELGRASSKQIGGRELTAAEQVAGKAADIKAKTAAAKPEKKPLTLEQMAVKDARLDVQVARVNGKLDSTEKLDPTLVKAAAKERSYDNVFYSRLGIIERNAEKGIHTPDPHEYLRTGLVQKSLYLHEIPAAIPKLTEVPAAREANNEELPVAFQSLQQSLNSLTRAMAAKGHTQDVRSEEEKVQDYEHEM